MTDRMVDVPILTETQERVVTSPWDEHVLVTAGAGAGKTTTMTHRLEYLTREEELEASEILVLSFSRAAVRELLDRIDRAGGTSRYVRAQTFDSWAGALLRQAAPDADLAGIGFDDRIEMAIDAIEHGVLDESEHGPPAHVIVDEVQDLVGVRGRLVQTLLERYADSIGFTVVGDSAQSIYGFQIEDPAQRTVETGRFIRWIRSTFADHLVEIVLGENFRARTDEARVGLEFGPRLQALSDAGEGDPVERYRELRTVVDSLEDFGDLDDPFIMDSLHLPDTTTAVLCRTNGQVLWLSDKLRSVGVPHRIQRSPRSRGAPAWLADLVAAAGRGVIDQERFHRILEESSAAVEDPGRAWRALRRVAGRSRNRLDTDVVRTRVRDGSTPDELADGGPAGLLLSSMHRAKGLEFDRVLIAVYEDDRPALGEDFDHAEEARLLFVAATRARDDVYRLTLPRWMPMRRSEPKKYPFPDGRWFLGGRKQWNRNGIEIVDIDVDRTRPPGDGVAGEDPRAVQRYLRASVHVGDQIEVVLMNRLPMAEDESPPYGVYHQGRLIGEASQSLRQMVWKLLKQRRNWTVERFPEAVRGVMVDGLESVAGDPVITERAGLGDSGMWVVPRLVGLGRFRWGEKEEEDDGDGRG